ncbi:MAG: hypothetical protein JWO78_1528 [Micavibrio sp.]|nr:hypothetical protein [Micavibrio sp.]
MLRILVLSLIITFGSFSAPALAQEQRKEPPIGTLAEVQGEGNLIMRAAEDGKAYPAHVKDLVYRNDVLQTGPHGLPGDNGKGGRPDARMLLVLIDESRFTLGENARFKVDEYAYDDKDKTTNNAIYEMLQGAFLYTSGFMTKIDNPAVRIQTPYGTIGIRGTSIWGGNLGAQYGVYVDEGDVSIETKRGHVMVPAGKATSINNINSIPQKPAPLSPEVIAAAKDTVKLQDIDKIKLRLAEINAMHKDMIVAHSQYIHATRIDQADDKSSVKKRGRGVMKIEQDRQDERKKLWEEDNPEAVDPMSVKDPPAKTPNETKPSAPASVNAPTAPTPPAAPVVKSPAAPTGSTAKEPAAAQPAADAPKKVPDGF